MKLTIASIPYKLSFAHKRVNKELRPGKPVDMRLATAARLTMLNEPFSEFLGVCVYPKIVPMKHGVSLYEFGRKGAFKKIMRHFTRPERTDGWNGYFARRIQHATKHNLVVINEASRLPQVTQSREVPVIDVEKVAVDERISFTAFNPSMLQLAAAEGSPV